MKSRWMPPGAALLVVVLLLWGAPAAAQDPAVEPVGDHGRIDWLEMKVVATGIGAPPEAYYGKPQARPMAIRAATTVARRNLLEVIRGVHIDSRTRVSNYMVADDTIEARVSGLIRGSEVADIQYMSDGTVEVTVSMPMTGPLGDVLYRLPPPPPEPAEPPPAAGPGGVEARLQRLEQRVARLEEKLTLLGNISAETDQLTELLGGLLQTWLEAPHPPSPAAYDTAGVDVPGLNAQVQQQARLLQELTDRLAALGERMARLEAAKPASPAPPPAAAAAVPYTGLVIDARGTGFRPCLKPGIYSGGERIYPGDRIDAAAAVRSGYVRYYRQLGRAQQSERVGALPYTVKAVGTRPGNRSLAIDTEAGSRLKVYREAPDSFLRKAHVVIVF